MAKSNDKCVENSLSKNTIECKDYISEIDNKKKYLRKITFPAMIYEENQWIKFKDPLWFECYFIEEEVDSRVACIVFDFGMEATVQLDPSRNFILKYSEGLCDEEKMAFDVKFDIFHAFFHVCEDPNYNYYHWALYGMLKDRVEIGEQL